MSESPVAVSYRPVVVKAHDCFLNHFCNQLEKSGSNLTISEIRKMAEERWKGMTVAEKRPYKEIAALQQEELGLEMPKGATAKVESSRKRKRVGGKPVKDPQAPKRATTGFFFFAQDERSNVKERNPEFKVTEISKELGKLWREMSDKQKEKYLLMAEKDKKRYEAEKAAYESRANQQSQGSGDDDEEDDE